MRTKIVQVAIQDPEYADSIRSLLIQGGDHRVALVEKPDVTLGGVIVVDAAQLNVFPWLANERRRLIVMVHNQRDDLSKIWDFGVRHVLFYGDPALVVRIMVMGLELRLGSNDVPSSA